MKRKRGQFSSGVIIGVDRTHLRPITRQAIRMRHSASVPYVRKHLGEAFGADAVGIASWCRHCRRKGLRLMSGY